MLIQTRRAELRLRPGRITLGGAVPETGDQTDDLVRPPADHVRHHVAPIGDQRGIVDVLPAQTRLPAPLAKAACGRSVVSVGGVLQRFERITWHDRRGDVRDDHPSPAADAAERPAGVAERLQSVEAGGPIGTN
jgi:hypothetical protein